MKPSGRADLASACHCLLAPGLAALDSELSGIGSLGRAERAALVAGAENSLTELLQRKLTRLLLVELHVARVSGALKAADSEGRWDEFVELAGSADFWRSLATQYPTLADRSTTLIQQRCRAVAELGRRFAADRTVIAGLVGRSEPELQSVRVGAGDSHRGGRAVAILDLADTKVVYKPRSVAVDRELELLLATIAPGGPGGRIRVPDVVVGTGYGWAEFVEHRYCRSDGELVQYYAGLGQWLAVAQLLNASDLHAENLIACGPIPIIVDCETLFNPYLAPPASGYGLAVDTASALLSNTVLRSGLLPGRGGGLGWRGVDYSGAGALPGQQPRGEVPQVIDAGTDRARIGSGPMPPIRSANLPSPEPQLRRFWPTVIAGFDQLSGRLRDLDAEGRLASLLKPFEQIEVRCVLRATEVYSELGRMLWHPAALHDEPAAVRRARDLLREQSDAATLVPFDSAVIESEVADLLIGDVPYFSGRPTDDHLLGPGGSRVSVNPDRVAEGLRQWRAADPAVQRMVMRSTLVSAYLEDGPVSTDTLPAVRPGRRGRLEQRRRQLAGRLVRRLVDTAILGDDGTATWIAPTLTGTGWSVQPLSPDAYSGTAGVAVVLAGQLHEAAAGRADPIDAVGDVLQRVLNTMRLAEAVHQRSRDQHRAVRPEAPGAYVGLGSRIWCWLLLRRLGVVADEGLDRAVELALLLPEAVVAASEPDLLLGVSGAAAALLLLAEESGEPTWLKQAAALGTQLCQAAVREPIGRARWLSPLAPDGLGGLAHGATGIGWVLARLAAATADERLAETAHAAFAFEESLYDEQQGGWRDLRFPETPLATAWCHGAVGIGLASADLVRSGAAASHGAVVKRAAATCWPAGPGDNSALCHGDAGRWELLAEAAALGLAPTGMDLAEVSDQLLASIEDRGVLTGIGDDACRPGLLSGQGGVAYQLLRMHPDSDLNSVLLPKLDGATRRPT